MYRSCCSLFRRAGESSSPHDVYPFRRYLTAPETLAFLAFQERSVDHPALMATLLDDCLALGEPLEIDNAASDTSPDAAPVVKIDRRHRRRYLGLIAQKGAQMMIGVQERKERGETVSESMLAEAWALLAAAAVQFRRYVPSSIALRFFQLIWGVIHGL
jgi:hypothetical protein